MGIFTRELCRPATKDIDLLIEFLDDRLIELDTVVANCNPTAEELEALKIDTTSKNQHMPMFSSAIPPWQLLHKTGG